MNTRLYVGNLSYSVTSDQLNTLFSQAGQVSEAVVITNRFNGRSKGFGFVQMATEEDAKKAIEMFNAKDHEGRPLVVKEARPQQPREGSPVPAKPVV